MRSGYEKASQTIGFTIVRFGYEKANQSIGFTISEVKRFGISNRRGLWSQGDGWWTGAVGRMGMGARAARTMPVKPSRRMMNSGAVGRMGMGQRQAVNKRKAKSRPFDLPRIPDGSGPYEAKGQKWDQDNKQKTFFLNFLCFFGEEVSWDCVKKKESWVRWVGTWHLYSWVHEVKQLKCNKKKSRKIGFWEGGYLIGGGLLIIRGEILPENFGGQGVI